MKLTSPQKECYDTVMNNTDLPCNSNINLKNFNDGNGIFIVNIVV
jgi:hypothetical protein